MSDQPLDLSALLSQAQEMMAGAAEAADETVIGQAGGGMVKIEVDGHFDFKTVTIDPSVANPDDVDMLQDLVLAALRDASTQLTDSQSDVLGGFDLGGMGLGDMLGDGTDTE